MLSSCILLCMHSGEFQIDCAVHIAWQSVSKHKRLSATTACWHAPSCYMRTAEQLMGMVTLLLIEQNVGLGIYKHVQDLHSIHSLQGSLCANTSKNLKKLACVNDESKGPGNNQEGD